MKLLRFGFFQSLKEKSIKKLIPKLNKNCILTNKSKFYHLVRNCGYETVRIFPLYQRRNLIVICKHNMQLQQHFYCAPQPLMTSLDLFFWKYKTGRKSSHWTTYNHKIKLLLKSQACRTHKDDRVQLLALHSPPPP